MVTGAGSRPWSRTLEPDRLPRELRLLLTAGLWVLVIGFVAHKVWHHMVTMPTGSGFNDSYIYLSAASNFLSHPSQLYDPAHAQVVTSVPTNAFVHPPSGLIAYLPLVPLVRLAGLPVAASVWSVVDTVALYAAIVLIGRRVGLSWLMLGAAALLISFTDPVAAEIGWGQINGVVLLLAAVSVLRMPRLDSGVFLGLALAAKPVSAILLLVPLLRGRPWITVVAAATFAVTNLAFVPLIGLSATIFYATTVLPFFASHVLRHANNGALPNALQVWFGGGVLPASAPFDTPVPNTLDGQLLLWSLRIIAVLIWLRAAAERKLDTMTVMALTMATVPFLSSTIWRHYLVYMVPLALVLLGARPLWARAAGVVGVVALFWSGPADGFWIGIGVLWLGAIALLVRTLGVRASLAPWRAAAAA